MKKAIIIGSSSGIGMQLAKVMSKDGFVLGLTGRRIELLNNLKNNLSTQAYTKQMDITNFNESISCLNSLIDEMEGVDVIIVCAGTGYINKNLEWKLEQETINTNVLGATAIIDASINYFISRKSGHLAVISSIASLRGSAECPAYNASKAYLSNYLEGIRCKMKKQNLDIAITDIKPGLVNTAMAKGDGLFWVMPLQKVTDQIYTALKKRKDQVYVTKRWAFLGLVLKLIPKSLYYKM